MEPAAGVGVECKAQARRKEHAAPGEGLIASSLLLGEGRWRFRSCPPLLTWFAFVRVLIFF
jgi:hypothetical protein